MHGTQNQAATSQFHWGSEASRTCIQFREIWGAEEAEGPHMLFPKTKQMQDIKCVYVCVCVRCIHSLKEVIVLRHEVQPNLWKETIQLCDGLSCVDTHGETSGIRWHSPSDSLSSMPFAHYYYDGDARVHNYSHDMEGRKRLMLILHSLHESQVGIILLYSARYKYDWWQ